MKKTLISLLAAICLSMPSFAQNDGWFASIGGGANINFEGYQHDSDDSGVTPALSIGIGKWINPNLGFKLGYDGMKLKNDTFFKDGIDCNAVSASILWNASNTISGEDNSRIFFIEPYAFVGAAFGYQTSLLAGAGLSFRFQINDAISIVPDLKATYLQDKIYTDIYDGKTLVLEPTIGLRYSF